MVVTAFGWRWGAFLAGTLFLVVGLPLCVGVRRSPESIGMAPDGKPLQSTQNASGLSKNPRDLYEEPDTTARQAMGTAIFWLLILSMTARSAAFTTVTTHLIPMMVWKGLSETEASAPLVVIIRIFDIHASKISSIKALYRTISKKLLS